MKKLLSLPPNLVDCFHDVENVSKEEYFCTSDPVGTKLGSGGGTNWLLSACHKEWSPNTEFTTWLSHEKRILLHAGGQSRRLPGYAPSGKVLTPIPVFRWKRGQRLGQNLLQLQLPLYERIMDAAPDSMHTLIASGDVYIRAGKLQTIPEADVVCYGLWVDPSLAKNHGVFVMNRQTPDVLDFMLQKPSVQTLGKLLHTHLFLMDVGIWLLSDRAVNLLMKRSTAADGSIANYDLYSDFGCSMGEHPTLDDPELAELKVAILPLQDGEFYHYGTSREMISSTVAIQNLVYDQRSIMHLGVKPHPSVFVQNVEMKFTWPQGIENIWLENSYLGEGWSVSKNNIVTGVPQNDWEIALQPGICIDVVPFGDKAYVVRPYGFNDSFRGPLNDSSVEYLGQPVTQWLQQRGLSPDSIEGNHDLQAARIFPVCEDIYVLGMMLKWMLGVDPEGLEYWYDAEKVSANEISDRANLRRLQAQRMELRKKNLAVLAKNRSSIFYQLNLDDVAHQFVDLGIEEPEILDEGAPLLHRISDHMFHSQIHTLQGKDGSQADRLAFQLLCDGLTRDVVAHKQDPHMDVYADQIVWGRSPVRIDIAGGWTDTPPHCLFNGANVVNFAIELNGQPPLQTYVKPSKEHKIVLRSIDLGASETIHTYEELADFAKVGSPFSIPKAALALAGFLPKFSAQRFNTLEEQLKAFGAGIEVTLLSAIPAGSGLGTSSILASTVLGALGDFCGLGWDRAEVCNRTLVLEQMLTTGGGWQDQYGGVLHGVKLLRTNSGFDQTPEVRWLPRTLFDAPEYAPCHLLYYTGITRTAKSILAEIVRGMFLLDTRRLELLSDMKEHALDLYESILHNDFEQTGRLIGKTWKQNQLLDDGTNPATVQAIIRQVEDLCLGLKLPGAGGGGYLYMVAKDPEAANRIKQILNANRPNSCARFVDMSLSKTGLQISRS